MSDLPLILIASADAELRAMVRDVLEGDVYRCIEAVDAESCIAECVVRQPTLLVLDHDLPPGGLVMLRQFRSAPSRDLLHLPILLLTATHVPDDDELMAGMTDVTVKPTYPATLRRRVRQLLRAAQVRVEQDKRREAEERLTRVITGARCILWLAQVHHAGGDQYLWQFQVFNEERAREFFPVLMQPGQSYTDAWTTSKLPEDMERTVRVYKQAFASGAAGYHQEFRCQTLLGVRWMYEDVHITLVAPGFWTLIGVCTDVTERKEAEAKLQNAYGELEKRIGERTSELRASQEALEVKSESLAVINTIADTLYRSLDFQTVVAQAVESLVDVAHFAAASIYVFDEPSQRIRLVAFRGYGEHIAQVGQTMPLEGNLTGMAIRTREMMLTHNIADDPRVSNETRSLFVAEGFTGGVILPLTIQDRVLGGMTLFMRDHQILTDDGMEMLTAISKTVALAMANAEYVARVRAERDHRQRAEAAEREQRLLAEALRDAAASLSSTLFIGEVLERVLDYVARVIPSDSSNIMLIEDGMARIVGTRGYIERGIDEESRALRFDIHTTPNLRQMIEQRAPLSVSETRHYPGWVLTPLSKWIRSYVGAPIIVDGQVIGFLNVDSATPEFFTEKHAGQLQAFANQAGIAIQNARYYQAIRRHASELEQRIQESTAELRLERAQLGAILDAMSEGVIYDEAFQVRYVNSAFKALTGYSADEITEYTEILRVPGMPPDQMAWMLAEIYDAVHTKGVWQRETRIRRKDGSEFDASVTCTRVSGTAGEMVGTVTIIRDISREKALQDQKSRFVARASHELRTPITNLKTRLYLIPRQRERADEHMHVIQQVTQHMERLVEDLLDMSRFERGMIALQRRETLVQNIINDVAAVQSVEAEARHLRLVVDMPPTPITVYADPMRIMQVLTNLVTNAIKYTPPDGVITLQLGVNAGYAEIMVSDTGIGIAPEHLPYVFDPFFRVDENTKGTGLGLSIAREIVELHRGEISVESERGKGARFKVRLALAHRLAHESAATGR
jgi:PAS domain S-box-containing protein